MSLRAVRTQFAIILSLAAAACGGGGGGGSNPPPPPLPPEVVSATTARYVEAYERITGRSFADWPGVS